MFDFEEFDFNELSVLARLGLWEHASLHISFEFYDFQIYRFADLLHFSYKTHQFPYDMTQHSYLCPA